MITYVDSSNLEKYEILFDRATKLLKSVDQSDPDSLFSQWKIVRAKELDKQVSALTEEELAEFDDYKISSLNEYFAYLSTIANMQEDQLSDEDKAYFLSLPLDEDTFNIDANSRVITVPTSFARNGIGIQSDELAEVIYFAIDRYFDSTDFASNDLSIAIQWEKGNESGLCRNYGKFLAGTQGQQKLIFGWPITTTLTKTPGVINFAVRIYALNDNSFKYSFMTLPAVVQIKESLKSGGDDKAAYVADADIEDASSKILNRIVNSTGVYDEYSPIPDVPVITKDIHFYELDGENYGQARVGTSYDLAENENINLAVSAKPGDSGILHYAWHKIPFNETTGEYDLADATLTAQTKVDYVRDTGAIVTGQQYYSKDQNDVYTIIENPSAGDEKYIRIARISAAAGNTPAGIYYPEVQAKLLVNSSATSKDNVAKVTIPGPDFPEIAEGDSLVHVFKDASGSVTITGTAITATDSSDLEAELAELDNSSVSRISISSGNRPEFTFSQGDNNKYYKINAYATRNKATVTTKGSIQYRVTPEPEAPNLGYIIGGGQTFENGNMSNYNQTQDSIVWRNAKYTHPVITSDTQHDQYTYYWIDPMISGIQGNPTGSNLFTQLENYKNSNDFQNLIDSINDYGVTDNTFTNKAIVLASGVASYNVGIEWPSDEELEALAPENTSYTDYEGDYDQGDSVSEITPVICLVVNELNGHYAAAASTFYLV